MNGLKLKMWAEINDFKQKKMIKCKLNADPNQKLFWFVFKCLYSKVGIKQHKMMSPYDIHSKSTIPQVGISKNMVFSLVKLEILSYLI